MGYTKLFSSIVHSTIWQRPNHVRIVWVTMLAMADQHGEVMASIPGLAKASGVTLDECEAALVELQAPDPYSRSTEHEGRRVGAIDGGWLLLNYAKYRAMMSADDRREKARVRQAKRRARMSADVTPAVTPCHKKSRLSRQAEAEADPEADHTHTGGARARVAASVPARQRDPRAVELTTALRCHRQLEVIHDAEAFADALLGLLDARGLADRVAWAKHAIAQAAADLPTGATEAAARSTVRRYVERCRDPAEQAPRRAGRRTAAEEHDDHRARIARQAERVRRLEAEERTG